MNQTLTAIPSRRRGMNRLACNLPWNTLEHAGRESYEWQVIAHRLLIEGQKIGHAQVARRELKNPTFSRRPDYLVFLRDVLVPQYQRRDEDLARWVGEII